MKYENEPRPDIDVCYLRSRWYNIVILVPEQKIAQPALLKTISYPNR